MADRTIIQLEQTPDPMIATIPTIVKKAHHNYILYEIDSHCSQCYPQVQIPRMILIGNGSKSQSEPTEATSTSALFGSNLGRGIMVDLS